MEMGGRGGRCSTLLDRSLVVGVVLETGEDVVGGNLDGHQGELGDRFIKGLFEYYFYYPALIDP